MTDDELDAVTDELVGNRNALLRIGSVVAVDDRDLLAIHAALGIGFCDCRFDTALDLLAESRLAAGQRCADAELDIGKRYAAHCNQCREADAAE